MFVEFRTKLGDRRIVNVDRILFCYEYRGGLRIELDDGTPLDVKTTREEFERAILAAKGTFVLCT